VQTSDSSPTSEETTDVPPPPPVELPELVTSGQGAYWQEGALTTDATGAASITINDATAYQEWTGMGGTFNEAGWDALAVLDAAERDRAIKLLFDGQDGARFSWGRIPIGASDYALERYTLNDTPNDAEMTNFSIERDQMYLIPYIKAALAYKPDLRLWASPWTPPAWMKSNNDLDGIKQGETAEAQIKNEPTVLSALALYLALFVEKYEAEAGLTIEAVHPQNEPGYATRYPSCLWSGAVMADFIKTYLGPTFEERGIDAEIWMGTLSNADAGKDLDLAATVMGDAAARAYIKGMGLQWNTIGSVGSFANNYDVPIIQTEHKCGNYHWNPAGFPPFNEDQPANDHAYAEESWGYIRDWIEAGVNSYNAWNMILDTKGHNSDYQRPWPQNALLTVDRTSNTLNVTPTYYVFRHVSQFVEPGAKRVAFTGSADALAFKNPDGGFVTIVYNSGGSPQAQTLTAGTRTVSFSVPAHGWATVNIEP
jgi:glucosylceramidase